MVKPGWGILFEPAEATFDSFSIPQSWFTPSAICVSCTLNRPMLFQPPWLFPFLLPWPITFSPISFQHIFTNTLAKKSVPYILLTNILPANILQNILALSLLPYIIQASPSPLLVSQSQLTRQCSLLFNFTQYVIFVFTQYVCKSLCGSLQDT